MQELAIEVDDTTTVKPQRHVNKLSTSYSTFSSHGGVIDLFILILQLALFSRIGLGHFNGTKAVVSYPIFRLNQTAMRGRARRQPGCVSVVGQYIGFTHVS